MTRTALRDLVSDCYRLLGPAETAHLVDGIKQIGFHYATRGGMTIAVSDITIPKEKPALLHAADDHVDDIDRQYQRGLITDEERYEKVVQIWKDTTQAVSDRMAESLDPTGAVTMMTTSGARGNKGNIGQLGGMRGLMADPTGRIIDVPVRSNFREGMTVLGVISTRRPRAGRHRAADRRLGLPDPATRRRGAGRSPVTTTAARKRTWITWRNDSPPAGGAFRRRSSDDWPQRLKTRLERPPCSSSRQEITEEIAARSVRPASTRCSMRSLTCERHGVCRACCGRNLATGHLSVPSSRHHRHSVDQRARRAADPRTFHTGRRKRLDITGLPRGGLFEARIPGARRSQPYRQRRGDLR
jgi:DNA-directed RNA polymerase subunit beta'